MNIRIAIIFIPAGDTVSFHKEFRAERIDEKAQQNKITYALFLK